VIGGESWNSDLFSLSKCLLPLYLRRAGHTWDHLAQCSLVLPLCLELPRFRRDDGGARDWGRPFDHQPLRWNMPRTRSERIRPVCNQRTIRRWMKLHQGQSGSGWFVSRCGDSQSKMLTSAGVLSAMPAAKRFFRKTLNAAHIQTPRVINVDKNAAHPPVITILSWRTTTKPELRQVKYQNIEQDHRDSSSAQQNSGGLFNSTALGEPWQEEWRQSTWPAKDKFKVLKRRCAITGRVCVPQLSESLLNWV